MSLELPLVIVNVQRGGPSTGLPTKTEQADFLQALYGRNGECPLPILAASTPGDCFWTAIEAVRVTGAVGASLQAELVLQVNEQDQALLDSLGDDLRFVFITSAVRLVSAAQFGVVVTPSSHAKCERCWHYRADVGSNPAHPTLCGRCDSNLHGAGETRTVA